MISVHEHPLPPDLICGTGFSQWQWLLPLRKHISVNVAADKVREFKQETNIASKLSPHHSQSLFFHVIQNGENILFSSYVIISFLSSLCHCRNPSLLFLQQILNQFPVPSLSMLFHAEHYKVILNTTFFVKPILQHPQLMPSQMGRRNELHSSY